MRVGVVGEYFTAADPHSNLGLERKLLDLGVEVHRQLNMTNRNLRYNERNLRAGISDYVRYDMGPTSSMTIAAALRYAQEGFDGVVHLKSAGCTPEIDVHPRAAAASAATTGLPYPVPELRLADQRHRPRHPARGVLRHACHEEGEDRYDEQRQLPRYRYRFYFHEGRHH